MCLEVDDAGVITTCSKLARPINNRVEWVHFYYIFEVVHLICYSSSFQPGVRETMSGNSRNQISCMLDTRVLKNVYFISDSNGII